MDEIRDIVFHQYHFDTSESLPRIRSMAKGHDQQSLDFIVESIIEHKSLENAYAVVIELERQREEHKGKIGYLGVTLTTEYTLTYAFCEKELA